MLSRLINQFLRNPTSLSDDSLEDEWADVKGRLLRTCPYTSENAYKSLYERCDVFLRTASRRHRHFILNAEAKSPFYKYMHTYADCLRMIDQKECKHIDPAVLPGLILAAYTGEETRTTGGENIANPPFVIRGINYLITERQDPVGLFLKGFVLKYGISIQFAPNLDAAEKYLQSAQSLGVGSASIELEYLHNHRRALSKIESIHTDSNRYDEWAIKATSAITAEISAFTDG